MINQQIKSHYRGYQIKYYMQMMQSYLVNAVEWKNDH